MLLLSPLGRPAGAKASPRVESVVSGASCVATLAPLRMSAQSPAAEAVRERCCGGGATAARPALPLHIKSTDDPLCDPCH